MDSIHKLFFTAFLILASSIDGARADALVTGTVFCDQCQDGQLSIFDYPLYGTKVLLACPDNKGQITTRMEDTTNWFGNFAMRLEGTPDLSNCYAQVSGTDQRSTSCGSSAGPARKLRPVFTFFGNEMYTVDHLLSEPAQPMPFCPRSSTPVPVPVPVIPIKPPSTPQVPVPVIPVKPPTLPQPSPPAFRFPPLPRLPPMPPLPPMPSFPFLDASACPHEMWTMREYRCYWRVVSPDTRVALIFGPLAASRYGTGLTLLQGLQGRGDPYRTLLREAITSFLNSYNSLQFTYNTPAVLLLFNWALVGSPRNVLLTALRFRRANSGHGNVTCKFTPCK